MLPPPLTHVLWLALAADPDLLVPTPTGCYYQARNSTNLRDIATKLTLPAAALLNYNLSNGTGSGQNISCNSTFVPWSTVNIPCPGPAFEQALSLHQASDSQSRC